MIADTRGRTFAMSRPPPSRFKTALAATLIRSALVGLSDSCRVIACEGGEILDQLVRHSRPVIFCFWHNRNFYFARFFEKRLIRRGGKMAVLISTSRDGEIGARLAEKAGVVTARGSPSRMGAQGLRRLYRLMTRDGYSIGLQPDGSRGPAYVSKLGTITLAKLTGCPIVPLSYSASRCWRTKSWDRLIIPQPFARIAVKIGTPIDVPRNVSDEQAEQLRANLDAKLNALTAATDRMVGA